MSIYSGRSHSTKHSRGGGHPQAHPDTRQHLPLNYSQGWFRRWSAPTRENWSSWISWETVSPTSPCKPRPRWGGFTCTCVSGPLSGEVRKWFLDQEFFLLTFMNYIQQPQGPDPWNPDHPTHSIKILPSTWLLFHGPWAHLSRALFQFLSDSSAPDMSQAFNKCWVVGRMDR